MNYDAIHIQKVSNGWVVRGDLGGSHGFAAEILAVFNNIDDMTQWVKDKFTPNQEKQCDPT